MKINWIKFFAGFVVISSLGFLFNNCSSGFQANSAPSASLLQGFQTVNSPANSISVDVGHCGPNGYINEPCVSVTICTPGTQQCQTVPNILLDTGSYGLRIFSSAITVGLTQMLDGSGKNIAQCAQFGTGSTWGPVKSADVKLGTEPTINIPIQVIDTTYATVPTDCTGLDTSPDTAGWNGILGVGNLTYDCGADCVNTQNNRIYFSCSGATCTSTAIPLSRQLINPIAALPIDNNGLILNLPSVTSTGLASTSGTVTFGVGTRSNNGSTAKTILYLDSAGDFSTQFNGKSYSTSFLDSGSNGIFFPGPTGLADCATNTLVTGFYCPPSPTSFSAALVASGSTTQKPASFEVRDANQLVNMYGLTSGAFNNLGGSSTTWFDWGLPFFFGKSVSVILENKSSPIGAGPIVAF
jgi:hypothetical protein